MKLLEIIICLNIKFQNHFEPIFKNHIWYEGTDFTGVVGVLTPSRHVNVLPNLIFVVADSWIVFS